MMEDRSIWECRKCTLKNKTDILCCEACGAEKLPHISQSSGQLNGDKDVIDLTTDDIPSNSEWKCQRCTFINLKTLLRCEVCDSPKVSKLPTESDINPIDVINLTEPDKVSTKKSKADKTGSVESLKNEIPTPSGASASLNDVDKMDVDLEWRCGKCSFSCNPPWSKSCETCGSIRKSLDSSAVKNKVSSSQVPLKSIVSTPCATAQLGTWICKDCTFKNNISDNICIICKNSKTESQDKFQWQCQSCSLMNSSVSDICMACKLSNCESSSSSMSMGKASFLSPVKKVNRQESSLVEDIRRIEESEASQLKQRIIQHCKMVNKPSFF